MQPTTPMIEAMAMLNVAKARLQEMATNGATAEAWLALARQCEAAARTARGQVGDRKPPMKRMQRDAWKMPHVPMCEPV